MVVDKILKLKRTISKDKISRRFYKDRIRNTLLKQAEKLSYVIDILDVLDLGMEGKMDTLTTMFAPLDFLNVLVYPSIRKPIENIWDGMIVDSVEEAKDKGLKGIYHLAEAKWFNRQKYGDYKYTLIDLEILDKLLRGEIETLKKLTNLYESQLIKNNYDNSMFRFTVLHYTIKVEESDEILTYIDTIYINN
nr:hypothetical protein [uncultured Flavobacterium sp.]